jgi:hypothetical protein
MQAHKPSPKTRAPARVPLTSVVDVDPGDLSQQLDETGEFHIEPLEVEAMPGAEARADEELAIELAEEEDDTAREDEAFGLTDATDPTVDDLDAQVTKDTGELYGVHTPPAVETDLAFGDTADEGEAPALGESWTEELLAKSSEMGAAPEHDIDVIDETDDARPHHSTESGDPPVADKGSGGIGGM